MKDLITRIPGALAALGKKVGLAVRAAIQKHPVFVKRVTCAVLSVAILFSMMSIRLVPVVSATDTPYYAWRQGDPQWGSKPLGTGGETVKSAGCLMTSVAMLIVHAGLRDEGNFDPGVFCDFLNANDGFIGSNYVWTAVTKLIPEFRFVESVALSGAAADKVATVKSYYDQGYYIVAAVRYGGHHVAVRSVSDGVIEMMDPASNYTNLFDGYDAAGVGKIYLYRSTATSAGAVPSQDVIAALPAPMTSAAISTGEIALYNRVDGDVVETVPGETTDFRIDRVYTSGWASVSCTVSGAAKSGYVRLSAFIDAGEPVSYGVANAETTAYLRSNMAETASVIPAQTALTCVGRSGEQVQVIASSGDETYQMAWVEQAAITFQSGTTYTYRVNTEYGLRLRSGPGTSYTGLDVIPYNTTVTVTTIQDGWGYTTYNGQAGWISLEYATLVSETTTTPVKETYRITATDGVNLREGTDTGTTKLAWMPYNTVVTVTEIYEGVYTWGKTTYNGKTGWFVLSYAEKVISNQKILYQLEADASGCRLTYAVGETALDLSRLVVKALYENGTSQTITNYTLSGFDTSVPGKKTVTVQYTENGVSKTTYFSIIVVMDAIQSIEVTKRPTKTVYGTGDAFDPSGMVVTAVYASGKRTELTGYTCHSGAIVEGTNNVVTVAYTAPTGITYSTTLTVTGINLTPTVTVGQAFAKQGTKVLVPVIVSDNRGFSGMALTFTYNTAAMKLVGVQNGAFGTATLASASVSPARVVLANADMANYEHNGILYYLEFEIVSGAAFGVYDIAVSYTDGDIRNVAGDKLSYVTESGKLKICEYLPGDVNDDGIVNVRDATALLRYCAKWPSITVNAAAADLDGDGDIGNRDATCLLRYLAGWKDAIPMA